MDRAIQDQTSSAQPEQQDELPTTLYTRQLYLPIMITVYQNLEPLNWDVLYLRDNMAITDTMFNEAMDKLSDRHTSDQPVEELIVITQQPNDDDKNPYCLLTLDVRNTWTIPFDLEFTVDNKDTIPIQSVLTIQPALTKRIVLPLKKLFLCAEERMQPIPSFEPNKQFVVSQAPKMPPEQERARLEMFWYREQLLSRVKATWRCASSGRQGIVPLRRSLRLTPLQLNVLKKQDIEFVVDMKEGTIGHRQFKCRVNSFVSMNVTIINRQGKKSLYFK